MPVRQLRFSEPEALYESIRLRIEDEVPPGSLVAMPTGSTPLPLYARVRANPRSRALWATFRFLQLDEYFEPPAGAEFFRDYLRRELFDPLELPSESVLDIEPFSHANATKRAEQLDAQFQRVGPPQLVVLGLGPNGHIAFNEPATDFADGYHFVELCPTTVRANVGSKIPNRSHYALTLSVPQILTAESVYLIVPQLEKQTVLDRVLGGPVSPMLPGSALIEHPNLSVFRRDTQSA